MEFGLDIIEDQKLITSIDREIQRDLIDIVERDQLAQMERQSRMVMLRTEPILHHRDISILVSNTAYRFYPKSINQKTQYLRLRKFSLLIYSYLLQRMDIIKAALYSIELVAEQLAGFDDIDYFVEFLFDPRLLNIQDKLITYLMLSQTNKTLYQEIKQSENKLELIPSEIDLTGINISRHKYIQYDSKYVWISKDKTLVEVPVPFLAHLPHARIVQLGYRKVGTTDKSLDKNYIRNALHDLFPLLTKQPHYQVLRPQRTNGHHELNIIQNALTLQFPDDSQYSKISVYQIMNTYLPLLRDPSSLNSQTLLSHTHKIEGYQNEFLIKFNPERLPDSYPTSELSSEVGIYELPVSQIPVLYRNLRIFANHLTHLFAMPKVEVDFYTLEITSDKLQPLFDYYNLNFGGEHTYLNLSYIEREELDADSIFIHTTLSLRQLRQAVQLRITLKSDYIKSQLTNIFHNVDKIEYLFKSTAIRAVIDLLEQYIMDEEVYQTTRTYLQTLLASLKEEDQ